MISAGSADASSRFKLLGRAQKDGHAPSERCPFGALVFASLGPSLAEVLWLPRRVEQGVLDALWHCRLGRTTFTSGLTTLASAAASKDLIYD
jgi:hypothetical protein